MCTVPPPPPPPAPMSLSTLDIVSTTFKDCNCNIYQPLINNPADCIWADRDPDLRRACIVARICISTPPHRYLCKRFKPILQVGPTCGLTALSMLIHEQMSLEAILTLAKEKGFTNHGEMLSCRDMGKLVGYVFKSTRVNNISHTLKRGDLSSIETIDFLLNGGALLVPYDADMNHAPALKNGHTAHWCLVCGIIILDKLDTSSSDTNNVYVLCRHGKSKFLSAWKLVDLAKSNRNLWEFSPKKQTDGLQYVQPEGGLGGEKGLRGQYLKFQWL